MAQHSPPQNCHSRDGGNPASFISGKESWVPAFAGMTIKVGVQDYDFFIVGLQNLNDALRN